MYKTKIISFIIFIAILSCEGISKYQYSQTKYSLECYKSINNEFTNKIGHEKLKGLISKVLRKKKKQFFSPNEKYILIPKEDVFKIIEKSTTKLCKQKLDSLGDFQGIRYINKDFLIYEVCRIRRITPMTTHLTGNDKPLETHRLIYNISKQKFDQREFLAKNERVSHNEKLDNEWLYFVSTID